MKYKEWKDQLKKLVGKNWRLVPGDNVLVSLKQKGLTPEQAYNYIRCEWARVADSPT